MRRCYGIILLTSVLAPLRIRISYNDVHKAIQNTAQQIKDEFGEPSRTTTYSPLTSLVVAPTLFIAIGGGGFIPARILRTFCKVDSDGVKRNIPIQAVGLVLYESMGGVSN